ncbi:outer membrane lipid asymmetry maintenance protein MlaD [Rickettsiaceae bacterium]|nr:outer membrane lipid asymmetry maintenance protein MlaD [Rickettsiaceae bacterium]
MKTNVIEILVGFIVILVAASFFWFAYGISDIKNSSTSYSVFASFQDIDGISKGTDVKLGGIKIGYVENLSIDKDTYYAVAKFYVDSHINIPKDSRAAISTSGLLGGKYIRIIPGNSDENIASGEKIKFTQSALNLEDLIAKLIYSVNGK